MTPAKLKVVNVISRDDGGGGRAAYRHHLGLRLIGVESVLFSKTLDSKDPHSVLFQPPGDHLSRYRRWWRRYVIQKQLAPYSSVLTSEVNWGFDDLTQNGSDPLRQMPSGDIINLHGVHAFCDLGAFLKEATVRSPVVWTLHALSAFTGGCTFAEGCNRFTQVCGCCPYLKSDDPQDASFDTWLRKYDAFQSITPGRLHLVSPSRWLAAEAQRSSIARHTPVSVIPYGIDTEAFAPRDQAAARREFGLPAGSKVIFFLTQFSLANRRKGLLQLLDALHQLKEMRDVVVLTAGRGTLPPDFPFRSVQLGVQSSDKVLSRAYSAADVTAVPSLEDNLPNVVLESLACGTPVVAFDVGGLPDMVRPGRTGLLAPLADTQVLSRNLGEVLTNDALRQTMKLECRRVAETEYSLAAQARSYLKLYERLLGHTG